MKRNESASQVITYYCYFDIRSDYIMMNKLFGNIIIIFILLCSVSAEFGNHGKFVDAMPILFLF